MIVQVIPPRVDVRTPLAVLPFPFTVRRTLLGPPLAAEIPSAAVPGSVGWSLQAYNRSMAADSNKAPLARTLPERKFGIRITQKGCERRLCVGV